MWKFFDGSIKSDVCAQGLSFKEEIHVAVSVGRTARSRASVKKCRFSAKTSFEEDFFQRKCENIFRLLLGTATAEKCVFFFAREREHTDTHTQVVCENERGENLLGEM